MKNTSEQYYIYDVLTDSHCRSVKLEKKKKPVKYIAFFFATNITLFVMSLKRMRPSCSLRENETLRDCLFKYWLFRKHNSKSDLVTETYGPECLKLLPAHKEPHAPSQEFCFSPVVSGQWNTFPGKPLVLGPKCGRFLRPGSLEEPELCSFPLLCNQISLFFPFPLFHW